MIPIGTLSPKALWPNDDTTGVVLGTRHVNQAPQWADLIVSAGDDAFVLGYPLGIEGGFGFPIWKRASVASEPDIDLDGLPRLLIDASTRKGMSGSPVIVVQSGVMRTPGADGSEYTLGRGSKFLGVYSGRMADDPMGASLGYVWKGRVIDEILDGRVKGEGCWD